MAVAGSPQTVRDFIAAEIEATAPNYFVPWLAFGDMDGRGSPAFGRSVRPRGDAGVQVTGIRKAAFPCFLTRVSCIARQNP